MYEHNNNTLSDNPIVIIQQSSDHDMSLASYLVKYM